MLLTDDGDVVRALGFVTMYAAWIEEDVDDILRLMDLVEPFDDKRQRWQISRKLKRAANLVRLLKSSELDGLPEALEEAIDLFERRNEFLHGRIYEGYDRIMYMKSGRANVPIKVVTSSEVYSLANELSDYRGLLIGPQLFRLPRAIEKYRKGYS